MHATVGGRWFAVGRAVLSEVRNPRGARGARGEAEGGLRGDSLGAGGA